jgi:galactose-1-phosphate uridylyltransferase
MRPVESTAIWKSSARLSDEREIVYYDETPGTGGAAVPDTRGLPTAAPAAPSVRWDPLSGEWVVIAAARQDRTFLPPAARAAAPEDRSRFAAHLQVLSVQRAPGKLKYRAGTESGRGVWINDVEPEAAARTLREVM